MRWPSQRSECPRPRAVPADWCAPRSSRRSRRRRRRFGESPRENSLFGRLEACDAGACECEDRPHWRRDVHVFAVVAPEQCQDVGFKAATAARRIRGEPLSKPDRKPDGASDALARGRAACHNHSGTSVVIEWQFRHRRENPGVTSPACHRAIRRSRLRYWIASARCAVVIPSAPARSAIVRATRTMRVYARADSPRRSLATSSNWRPR